MLTMKVCAAYGVAIALCVSLSSTSRADSTIRDRNRKAERREKNNIREKFPVARRYFVGFSRTIHFRDGLRATYEAWGGKWDETICRAVKDIYADYRRVRDEAKEFGIDIDSQGTIDEGQLFVEHWEGNRFINTKTPRSWIFYGVWRIPEDFNIEATEGGGAELRTIEPLEDGQSSVGGALTANGGYLYWWDMRSNGLRRARIKDDGTLRASHEVTEANDEAFSNPQNGVAIADDWLYYFDTRQSQLHLRRIGLNSDGQAVGRTKGVEDKPTSLDATKGIAIGAEGNRRYLYYWDTRPNHQNVRRAVIEESGLGNSSGVESGESSVGGCLAVADGYLYWWDTRDAYRSLRRAKIEKDGTLGRSREVEAAPSSIDPTKGLAISGKFFYWWDTDDQQLVVGTLEE